MRSSLLGLSARRLGGITESSPAQSVSVRSFLLGLSARRLGKVAELTPDLTESRQSSLLQDRNFREAERKKMPGSIILLAARSRRARLKVPSSSYKVQATHARASVLKQAL